MLCLLKKETQITILKLKKILLNCLIHLKEWGVNSSSILFI